MSVDRKKLVERASAAVSRGKYMRALEAYRELERLEPDDGAWARRSGEMLRHLGESSDAVRSFGRAVEVYARAGFLVKAIAVCKLILRIEPGHRTASEKIEQLTRERFAGQPRREIGAPRAYQRASTGSPSPRAHARGRPTIPPGQALEDVVLADAVPGAEVSKEDKRITLIPIDTSDFDTFSPINDDVSEALLATPLFEGLAATNLQALLEAVTVRELEAGDVVFRQGDRGGEMFVIDEGKVSVLADGLDGGQPVELDVLGEGEFFGEIGLIADSPRSATITALERTELLALSREAISNLVGKEPGVLGLLLRFLKQRLLDRLTKTHPLMASFSASERAALIDRFQFLEAARGAVLINEGQRSRGVFVLLAGALDVTRAAEGEPRVIATLGPGDVTGEMSLLTQEAAVATVTTTSKAFVVYMPAADFRQLIMTHPQILAYVGDLAEHRQRLVDSLEAGSDEASFEDLHVNLL